MVLARPGFLRDVLRWRWENRPNTFMKSRFALLAIPVFLSSCLIPNLGISAHAGYMQLRPTGNVALEDSGATNSVNDVRIDLKSGFDVSDAGTPFAAGRVELGEWEVSASTFYYDESSSSAITRDFGDIQASPASPTAVNSDLTIFNLRAAVAYQIVDLDLLDVSAGIALDFFDASMDVRSATAIENMSFTAPVPMLYARASTDVGIVSGTVELGWLDIDLGDAAGSYFDLNAMISVSPIPKLEIVAGYRNVDIDVEGHIDNQDFGTHLRMAGWYVGGGVTF